MAMDFAQRVRIVNPSPNVDILWGPYDSVSEANTAISNAGLLTIDSVGRVVGIKTTGDTIVEYRYEKTSGGTYDWVPVTNALMETIDEVIDNKIENKAFVYSLIPLYQGDTGATPCHALVI